MSSDWAIHPSVYARSCKNPLGAIVECMVLKPNPEKNMISLSIGDPTVFGNLKTSASVVEAVVESARSMKYNGYGQTSLGQLPAREAVAKYSSYTGLQYRPDDVILCSGCSHSLEICVMALASPGQNILIPRPGFPLYQTLAGYLNIDTKQYDLLADQDWEIDIDHLESLIDENTAAVVVNNPSNPCGSVYNREHLKKVVRICSRHRVPIIADEIYERMVFEGHEFVPLAQLCDEVPVLTCGGMGKRFLVPGWRLGWILIHDPRGYFQNGVRQGLISLTQRILGCSTLLQGAIPTILNETPKEFFSDVMADVEKIAAFAYSALRRVPGLRPIMPAGAIYMMVGIDLEHFPEFKTDLEFVTALVSEQSVFCLPGAVFELPGYVRMTVTIPLEKLQKACERIRDFCLNHYKDTAARLRLSSCPDSPMQVDVKESQMRNTASLQHLNQMRSDTRHGFGLC